jgi:hypothetical protein
VIQMIRIHLERQPPAPPPCIATDDAAPANHAAPAGRFLWFPWR